MLRFPAPFARRGRSRSVISASCEAPAGSRSSKRSASQRSKAKRKTGIVHPLARGVVAEVSRRRKKRRESIGRTGNARPKSEVAPNLFRRVLKHSVNNRSAGLRTRSRCVALFRSRIPKVTLTAQAASPLPTATGDSTGANVVPSSRPVLATRCGLGGPRSGLHKPTAS